MQWVDGRMRHPERPGEPLRAAVHRPSVGRGFEQAAGHRQEQAAGHRQEVDCRSVSRRSRALQPERITADSIGRGRQTAGFEPVAGFDGATVILDTAASGGGLLGTAGPATRAIREAARPSADTAAGSSLRSRRSTSGPLGPRRSTIFYPRVLEENRGLREAPRTRRRFTFKGEQLSPENRCFACFGKPGPFRMHP